MFAAILGFDLTANSKENNKKDMKTLVVYFSATGTTKAYPQYNWGESRLMNM